MSLITMYCKLDHVARPLWVTVDINTEHASKRKTAVPNGGEKEHSVHAASQGLCIFSIKSVTFTKYHFQLISGACR